MAASPTAVGRDGSNKPICGEKTGARAGESDITPDAEPSGANLMMARMGRTFAQLAAYIGVNAAAQRAREIARRATTTTAPPPPTSPIRGPGDVRRYNVEAARLRSARTIGAARGRRWARPSVRRLLRPGFFLQWQSRPRSAAWGVAIHSRSRCGHSP